jgi:tRNA(Ile)-lysidine synthase
LKNFESLARRQRFQVLGMACRDHEINSLFLAHHEDDQAETLMMRLIGGHRALGLMGMKPSSEIPECEGIYGVHQSGSSNFGVRGAGWGSTLQNTSGSLEFSNLTRRSLLKETGGVRIYRPLLAFNKTRLVATCRASGTKWFEDKTNADPKLTVRNAIRHMLHSDKMPAALQTTKLISLSQRLNMKSDMLRSATNALFKPGKDKAGSMYLETQVGTLRMRFPNLGDLEVTKEDRGRAGALLLRQVIMMVTPMSNILLSRLHQAIDYVFPELQPNEEKKLPPSSFTIGGVKFKQHSIPVPQGSELVSKDQKPFWLLSRQPYSRADPPPVIAIPGSESPASDTDLKNWSEWQLYDRRFWFRIRNRSSTPLTVRPFNQEDMANIRNSVKGSQPLNRLLWRIAPDDVRWTLPAIVTKGVDRKESMLALPTLGVILPQAEEMFRTVDWEFRYKKVDLPINEARIAKIKE